MTDPATFFGERGWSLRFHEEDGVVWAGLVSKRRKLTRRRERVVSKYGRGADRASAAQSAMARWESEQAT